MEIAFLAAFAMCCLVCTLRPPFAFALVLLMFPLEQVVQAHAPGLTSSALGIKAVNIGVGLTALFSAAKVLLTRPGARFAWCVRQYLVWATGAEPGQSPKSVLSVLKAIDRASLPETMRVTRDELLGCLAIETNRHELAISLAEDVPASERSKKLTRMIETACYVRLQNALSRAAIEDAAPAWRAIVLVCESDELRAALTAPLRKSITSPIRRRIWIRTLEDLKSRSGIDPKLKNGSRNC